MCIRDSLKAKLGELFLAAMDKSTDVTETFMMIDVEKKGSSWVVDEDSLASEVENIFGV